MREIESHAAHHDLVPCGWGHRTVEAECLGGVVERERAAAWRLAEGLAPPGTTRSAAGGTSRDGAAHRPTVAGRLGSRTGRESAAARGGLTMHSVGIRRWDSVGIALGSRWDRVGMAAFVRVPQLYVSGHRLDDVDLGRAAALQRVQAVAGRGVAR
eukprot:5027362-Prymnesium_polylepis.2